MIKSKFNSEPVSIKIGIVFAKLGISPNLWTIGAIIPAALGFLCLAFHNLVGGLIFFIISGFIDAVDGAVARVTGNVTSYGAFLDGIIDIYVEVLLYIGLLFYLPETHGFLSNSIWISLLIFGALMPTYVRAYADHKGVVTEGEDQKRMGGILERFERMTLIFIGMLAGCFNPTYLTYMIIIVAILSNLTALQRILFIVLKTK